LVIEKAVPVRHRWYWLCAAGPIWAGQRDDYHQVAVFKVRADL
jgi:hypothetical protein